MEGEYIRGTNRMGVIQVAAIALSWLESSAGMAVVNNFLNDFLVGIFGGGPSRWENAGQGVHEWFTQFGEQAFLDWMDATHPDKFGSLETVKALHYVWTVTVADVNAPAPYTGMINNLAQPNYMLSAPRMNELFATMGIDLPASVARQFASSDPGYAPNTVLRPNIVAIPGFGQVVNNAIDDTIDAIGSGDALTAEQIAIAEALKDESDAAARKDKIVTAVSVAAGLAAFMR